MLMLGYDNVPDSWVRAWNHQERPPGAKSLSETPRPPSTHRPASQDRHISSMYMLGVYKFKKIRKV